MKRTKSWLIGLCGFIGAALLLATARAGDSGPGQLKQLERSFTVHASLANFSQNFAWSTNSHSVATPTEEEIRNAARLLTEEYAANRIYLLYEKEMPLHEAQQVFERWRGSCSAEIDIVPTLLLRSDRNSHIFSAAEAQKLAGFFKTEVNPARLALINADNSARQAPCLEILAGEFKNGLLRLGLSLGEKLNRPFAGGVRDTWTVFCTGRNNEEWEKADAGLDAVRNRIAATNNEPFRVSWKLIVAAADSTTTNASVMRDDPERNAPLPDGRNLIMATELLRHAQPAAFTGFNCDLQALQASSQSVSHDGSGYAFYEMLKRGQTYVGYYARPFHEIVKIYGDLRAGRFPERPGVSSH